MPPSTPVIPEAEPGEGRGRLSGTLCSKLDEVPDRCAARAGARIAPSGMTVDRIDPEAHL
jgi:hypothetical protein